ncbi:MAG: hypothetical protein DRI57_06855 [Deltaproteobacteria bacterium]|nr:MAG: hypothetical protein DRI57_06855 [Deltaproteobacteria bacterium]
MNSGKAAYLQAVQEERLRTGLQTPSGRQYIKSDVNSGKAAYLQAVQEERLRTGLQTPSGRQWNRTYQV